MNLSFNLITHHSPHNTQIKMSLNLFPPLIIYFFIHFLFSSFLLRLTLSLIISSSRISRRLIPLFLGTILLALNYHTKPKLSNLHKDL